MGRLCDFVEEPPEFGLIEFTADVTPVSLQAPGERRRRLQEKVREIVRSVKYLLTGEVQINIEWFLHEKERYESVSSPDVDNVIKPLLDAISGPDGLIINDCQVQAVTCHWVDWVRNDQQLIFQVRFMPDLWVHKERLKFVHFGKGLCFPLEGNVPEKEKSMLVQMVQKMLTARDKLDSEGIDYYQSRIVLPAQKFFHRARLRGFAVVDADDLGRHTSTT